MRFAHPPRLACITQMSTIHRNSASAATLQTSFLIPNLHCPTCVNRIEELVSELNPAPVVENISIVDHMVTIKHLASITAASISKLLSSAAYEVFDTILDPASDEASVPGTKDSAQLESGQLDSAILRWDPKYSEQDGLAREQHDRNCQLCAAYRSEKEGMQEKAIVVAGADVDTPNYQAIFSIDGMTCGSCIGKITAALHKVAGVIKADVALVSLSADVRFSAREPSVFVEELIAAVREVGYRADLTELKPVRSSQSAKPQSNNDAWRAIYSIDGMTCSSCVGTVANAVEALEFVDRVDINLVAHSGTVDFKGKENEYLIASAIDSVGYEATKVELKNVAEEESNQSRTVSFEIQSMHCGQCPDRIVAALQKFQLEVERSPTLQDPILTVAYVPKVPSLTVRSIIATITDIDKAFTVRIYHPPSVEERSRKMLVRERTSILRRVIFSATIAIPTLVLAVVYMNLVPHDDAGYMYLMQPLHGVTRLEWATLILATPVYFYGADHFHRRALKEIYALWRPRSTTPMLRRFYRFGSMNMLVSLGTTIAYVSSLAQLITAAASPTRQTTRGAANHNYFDSVVFLSVFLLAGRLIEAHMKAKSGDAVAALGKLRPAEAALVTGNGDDESSIDTVSVDLIDMGDVVKVAQGSSPPCDGLLIDSLGDFDEASLTGESRVITKQRGDQVFSGTINRGSAVSVRVTGPFGNSLLDSIIQVVREGQAKRAPMERVADLLTAYFVPAVVLIAIVTWIIWLALGLSGVLPDSYLDSDLGGWPFWSLQFAIAVFVVACPCGLGLAAPTALFVGGGMAAKRGILVKGGGEAFQEASNLDAVVFDKTGTLTEESPKIVEQRIFTYGTRLDPAAILGVLKAIEENSGHPLAKALVTFADHESATPIRLTAVEEVAGKGLQATLLGQRDSQAASKALVGNESLMQDFGVIVSRDAGSLLESWKSLGHSVVLQAIEASGQWHLAAVFAAATPLRQEAPDVIKELHSQRIAVWMLSGDNPSTAKAVGAQVGIPPDKIIAGVLPAQKADKVKQLQRTAAKSQGKGLLSRLRNRRSRATIAMVGDGINDAPALAAADVGIALAAGSDVAVQSAAFVLVQSDLRAVLTLVTLSRAVFRRVIQNFFWAVIYNMVALPIAAGVLYPVNSGGTHIRLDPAWAALAMALSSITVVGSSLLLRTRIPLVGFREG